MSTESITKQDLTELKTELLKELRKIAPPPPPQVQRLLRSRDVKEMLKISSGTLQNLRENGVLTHLKIGGSIYYPYDEIINLTEQYKIKK